MQRQHASSRVLTTLKGAAAALAAMVVVSILASSVAEARCGSHGGPGYRRADGKCASHKD
ncbi:MAG: hypothetical protein K0Q54_1979 [Methylobacterium brachiatum]|jgi:hypothetical protein|nr:hypothetical protein [Methylobacterium brachiatum]